VKIPFAKYHGAGNDFIVIDCRRFPPQFDFTSLARSLCDRRKGIGADGLILLCSSTVADYKMRIINADGSEPSMCGNGLRCLFDFVQTQQNHISELKIETLHGIMKCRRVESEIAVNLGAPRILHWPIELPQGLAFVINTGVPHAVLFDDDIDARNLIEEGAKIRFDPRFAPVGVNVNFAAVKSSTHIAMRSYERGVEGETLACGTGAAAVAYVAHKQFNLSQPISVSTRLCFGPEPIVYNQTLHFQFTPDNLGDLEIEMIGPATKTFEGAVDQ
jgi:diaminopimelate epimerase